MTKTVEKTPYFNLITPLIKNYVPRTPTTDFLSSLRFLMCVSCRRLYSSHSSLPRIKTTLNIASTPKFPAIARVVMMIFDRRSALMICFALCAATFAAHARSSPIHLLNAPLPSVSLCKPNDSAPAFFCTGGNLFVPRGANYIRLWPTDAPAYHRCCFSSGLVTLEILITLDSTFSPLHHEQSKAEAAGDTSMWRHSTVLHPSRLPRVVDPGLLQLLPLPALATTS